MRTQILVTLALLTICTIARAQSTFYYPNAQNPAFTVSGVRAITASGPNAKGEYDLFVYSNSGDTVLLTANQSGLRFDYLSLERFSGTGNAVYNFDISGAIPIAYVRRLSEEIAEFPTAQVTVRGAASAPHIGAVENLGVTKVLDLELSGNLGAIDSISGVGLGAYVYANVDGLVVGGDMLAQMHVLGIGTSIVSLDVRGAIGQPNSPNVGTIRTRGNIGSITAGVIFADILPGILESQPYRGDVGRIECTTLTGFSGGGHLKGKIEARSILDQVRILGDLQGQIDLTGDLVNTPVIAPSFPAIQVDGSFLDVATGPEITLPANGLKGQIVFNSVLQGGEVWAGQIRVGPVSGGVILDDAAYSSTPSQIGGGSVGLARYTDHPSGCTPTEGTHLIYPGPQYWGVPCDELNPSESSFSLAYIQLYGPVELLSDPILVQARPVGSGTPWEQIEDSSNYYTFSLVDTAQNLRNRIKVERSSNFVPDYEYRFTHKTGKVKCRFASNAGGGQGDLRPDASVEYRLTLRWECDDEEQLLVAYDLNEDDAVTAAGDLGAWLGDPSDCNLDGLTNAGDVGSILEAAALWSNLHPN